MKRTITFCYHCNEPITHRITEKRKYHHECWKKNYLGGFVQGSGKSIFKKGRYKGIWCDSSWELAWVIYHLDHGIKFERNTEGFTYELGKYYPDFILEDGTYVEIKGYKTQKDELKWKSFPYKLQVLYHKDMIHILKEIQRIYGRNFISLYEGTILNSCKICNKPCKNKYCSSSCSGKASAQRNKSPEIRERFRKISLGALI